MESAKQNQNESCKSNPIHRLISSYSPPTQFFFHSKKSLSLFLCLCTIVLSALFLCREEQSPENEQSPESVCSSIWFLSSFSQKYFYQVSANSISIKFETYFYQVLKVLLSSFSQKYFYQVSKVFLPSFQSISIKFQPKVFLAKIFRHPFYLVPSSEKLGPLFVKAERGWRR